MELDRRQERQEQASVETGLRVQPDARQVVHPAAILNDCRREVALGGTTQDPGLATVNVDLGPLVKSWIAQVAIRRHGRTLGLVGGKPLVEGLPVAQWLRSDRESDLGVGGQELVGRGRGTDTGVGRRRGSIGREYHRHRRPVGRIADGVTDRVRDPRQPCPGIDERHGEGAQGSRRGYQGRW